MNYIKKNVQAENIIASEPPKILQVKSWSNSLCWSSRICPRVVSLICPI